MTNFSIVPSESTLAPWDRMENESPKAYAAFCLYKKLPPLGPVHAKRSIANVCRELYGEPKETAIRAMAKWSSKFAWVVRAAAWDQDQEVQLRETRTKAIKDANERHVKIALTMQQKAIERLKAMDPAELTVAELKSYLMDAIRLERLALGEPEERTEVTVLTDIVDYSTLTPEDLRKAMIARIAQFPAEAVSHKNDE